MPGVLIVEALAQVSGILAFTTAKVTAYTDAHFYFVGIDKARFRKPVEPGDQLILKVTLTRAFKGIWKFDGVAEVDGAEVASAELMVAPEINPRRAATPASPATDAEPGTPGDGG
jgi:3-hydroxyacyl-[acyl-carrier-protein] dehydratase